MRVNPTLDEQAERDALISEFMSLLQENEESLEQIQGFSDPQWQQDVSLENLSFLIEKEKEYKRAKEKAGDGMWIWRNKKRIREAREGQDRESFIINAISQFSEGDEFQETQDMFQEIFAQRGFGQGKYHKWDVYDHTRNSIQIFRNLEGLPDWVETYLDGEIDDLTRRTLVELALCFHDMAKMVVHKNTGRMHGHEEYAAQNSMGVIRGRFKLTDAQTAFIRDLIYYHGKYREEDPALEKELKERGIFLEELLLDTADLYATQGESVTKESLDARRIFVQRKILELYKGMTQN